MLPKPKVLLLDMDGVVLHQPNMHRFVAMRVGAFVRRKLDPIIPNITYDKAESINRSLYTTYGHTLIGLNSVFKTNTSIAEFNSVVYDSITMDYIPNFQDDGMMRKNANEVLQVLEECHMRNIPVYIFSNAPIRWNRAVLDMMGLPVRTDHILGSDHAVFDRKGLLKPQIGLYHEVANLMSYRHNGNHELVFVDDSLMNLRPCMGNGTWRPVLFNHNMVSLDTDTMAICSNMLGTLDLL